MRIVTEEAKQAEAQRIELRNAALRRLEAYILAEPRRFNMITWGIISKEQGKYSILEDQKPPCRTVGCFAGNAVLMDGKYRLGWSRKDGEVFVTEGRKRLDVNIEYLASEILHLTYAEKNLLFFMPEMHLADTGWPGNFERAYVVEKDLYKKAQIAVNRIEHFIATEK